MKTRYSAIRKVAVILLMAGNSVGFAYEAVEVTDGGTISGKITFSGSPPANPTLSITKDQDFCGSSLSADYVVVGSDGGLKNVVIVIENIEQGKEFDRAAVVEFENTKCMFEPHVSTAVVGQKLGIVSRDPILHNTHLYHGPKERTLFNIAIPFEDKVIKKPLRKPGQVTVKCDAHEWMLGYVYVSRNPYITVTSTDGSYTIGDVPPGTYTLKIWHEKLGETTVEVTVNSGQDSVIEHAYSGAG